MLSPKSLTIFCLCFVQLALIKAQSSTTAAERPYIVQVLYQDKFHCAGSLISSKVVVTAAHCVYGKNQKQFKVRGGATLLNGSDGVTRDVSKIKMSMAHNPLTNDMDVATLELSSDLIGANIKPITLIASEVPVGATVTVSGWGYTQAYNKRPSNQLLTVQLNKISTDACRTQYPYNHVSDNMMCAIQPGKDSCTGDSGAPVTYNGQLAGIVSTMWDTGCAKINSAGYYTDVVKARDFINGVLGSL